MRRWKTLGRSAAVGLVAVGLAACAGSLTADNYAKLKTGMPYEEVRTLFGNPTSCSDVLGVKNCRWGDEQRWVNVHFVGDKTVFFMAENIK